MATILDVAKKAGVGKATVSRVISGNGYVKDTTREKVMAAIEALDYMPSEAARNLSYNKTNLVAVIVPEISQPFFAEILTYTESALASHGYRMIVCNTGGSQEAESECMEMLRKKQVDGIIFASHTIDIDEYKVIGRPIVTFDRIIGPDIPCVQSDHRNGGRLAAEALIKAGCKCVLQLRDSGKLCAPYTVRHDVFEQVMIEHHIPCISYNLEWNNMDKDYYKSFAQNILETYPQVDGIFAVDELAMAVAKRAMELHKRIPEEFKIVAYDGTRATNFFNPELTVIRQPVKDLAQTLADTLIQVINGEKTSGGITMLPVTIIEGKTT